MATVEIKEEIASLVNGHTHGLLLLIICNTNKGPFVPSKAESSGAQFIKFCFKIKIIVYFICVCSEKAFFYFVS